MDTTMKSMTVFCDEIIEKVYTGQPKYGYEGDFFLDCYYDMAIHLCGSHRLILETKNYYLSLEPVGVIKLDKTEPIESFEKEGEWIDPCIHVDEEFDDTWVDYESTLFVGERLVSVQQTKVGYLLAFDDFELKLIPHASEDEFPCRYPHAYSRVYGTERLINKCRCGGTGELDIDFVSDYGIRCNKCHLGTSAYQCACDAIDEWNNGTELYEIGNYPEEDFRLLCNEPVEYIVIDRLFEKMLTDSLRCNSVIVEMGGQQFVIESRYAGNGKYTFCFEDCSSFNPEMWPRKISAARNGPISLSLNNGFPRQESLLIFHIGKRILTITAEKSFLTITPVDGLLEKTE